MQLAATIARYLLGVMFTVFGANGFLHFLKQPPPSSAFAMQFLTAVSGSGFMILIFALQLVAGLLLLADRFVPLALVVLAAILINILNFHLTMDPGGIAPGLVATVLWFIVAFGFRANFRALLTPNAERTNGLR